MIKMNKMYLMIYEGMCLFFTYDAEQHSVEAH